MGRIFSTNQDDPKSKLPVWDFTKNMFCTTTLFWSITNHPPPRERHFGHLLRHPLTCDSQKALETVCWMGSSGFEHLRLPFNTMLMPSWVENKNTSSCLHFSSVLPLNGKKKMIPRLKWRQWVVWKSVSTLLFINLNRKIYLFFFKKKNERTSLPTSEILTSGN